jgi:hypothetical protein
MTAYLIVEHKITDATKFEEYRVKVREARRTYLDKGRHAQAARGWPLETRTSRNFRVSRHELT